MKPNKIVLVLSSVVYFNYPLELLRLFFNKNNNLCLYRKHVKVLHKHSWRDQLLKKKKQQQKLAILLHPEESYFFSLYYALPPGDEFMRPLAPTSPTSGPAVFSLLLRGEDDTYRACLESSVPAIFN
jgi:hypothetical protein